MPSDSQFKVAAVTVTYGNRFHLMNEVVEAAFSNGVVKVVIVDNGATCESAKKIDDIAARRSDNIIVIRLGENLGSARGFGAGIKAANELTDVNFIWLLDDDNRPLAHSLDKLLKAYKDLGCVDSIALLSLRRDRIEFLNAAQTGIPLDVHLNAFQGFHMRNIPARIVKKIFRNNVCVKQKFTSTTSLVRVSYAPYGGFFFHKNWVSRIGVPDERFYLYGDDHEYTFRLLQQQGKIYLCADSEIEDLEQSWHLQERKVPAFFSDSVNEMRIFYNMRNRVFFEKKFLTSHNIIYFANMWLYLFYLILRTFLCGTPLSFIRKRTKLIISAIRAGLSGNLGKAEGNNLL